MAAETCTKQFCRTASWWIQVESNYVNLGFIFQVVIISDIVWKESDVTGVKVLLDTIW
jgi:hypothetical protein